jgi:REP element-mobilizing transposase RayT
MDAHYDELIRQGKLKRIFRAKQKLTVPDIVSHITQRAAGKDPLFLEETDYLFMLANMKDIIQKRSLDIYAFCLMPNHIHLLASPREDELHESMRDLFSRYAMMFNRKYERKGHLFAGPYRQAVCLEDAYSRNGGRWQLCKRIQGLAPRRCGIGVLPFLPRNRLRWKPLKCSAGWNLLLHSNTSIKRHSTRIFAANLLTL